MFERFSDASRNLIFAAREESTRAPRGVMDSGHVLTALSREDGSLFAGVLARLEVSPEHVRRSVDDVAGTSGTASDRVSEELSHLMSEAVSISKALKDERVEPYHFVLAFTVQDRCVAARSLTAAGVDIDRLRQVTLELAGAARREEQLSGAPHRARRGGKKSMVEEFTTDLTEQARDGLLDPVVGRDVEMERVLQVLCRRSKNNPVLVGDPGVGKTALAEGLAQRIVDGHVPDLLAGASVLSVDLGMLVAGTRHRGDFEERVKALLDEVDGRDGNVVLFIDEIHTMVGAGTSQGSGMGAGDLLKPVLARGEVKLVGATTMDEYRKHIESDAALERRFAQVHVGEPSASEAVEILQRLQPIYEQHHDVVYTDGAVHAAVTLSDRYLRDRFLPDKAIDLIDEVGARMRLTRGQDGSGEARTVGENDVAELVASMTGVPVAAVAGSEGDRLRTMHVALSGRVVGQPKAVEAVTRAVRRARLGLGDARRPIGSFVFAGPTGVGKTEMAKALAENLFGNEDALITVDMSEYGERHTMSRLFGSPPGFVGHEEGGELTEKIRRRPYSVVLLDEVEKAHPDVFDAFLQVLDEGRLTDGQGRKVDFSNTVIIMTTNLGSDGIAKGLATGFGHAGGANSDERLVQKVKADMKQHFRPEFLNRLDSVVVFTPLTRDAVMTIVDLQMAQVQSRLEERGISLSVTDAAREYLTSAGWDPAMGARPLRRAIQREVEDRLADMLLSGALQSGHKVEVDAVDGIVVTAVPQFEPANV